MTDVLKNTILSMTTDIEFMYKDKLGSVCPFARDDISVTYNGVTHDFGNVDAALSAPVFAGRSLTEIADEIDW
jgi:hypothetical protein